MKKLKMYAKRLFRIGFCVFAGTLLPAAVFAGDPWLQEAKLIASDGDVDHGFGQAIALSGDTVLVSRQDPFFGPQSVSRVYVFVHDGEDWVEQATLFPDDHPVDCFGTHNDRCPFFGWSVASDGNVAVVGAPVSPLSESGQPGAAYVFARKGGVWSQQTKLVASDGTPDDKFGQSVAISGDTVLIGAPAAEVDGHTRQGSAYVFVFDGEDWVEQERLMPTDDFPVDPCGPSICPFFGNAVALLGDTALVGAQNMRIDDNNRQGAAYVFTRGAGVWTEQAMLTAAEGAGEHRFGSAVALSEDVALVSATEAEIDFTRQGAAYVFTRSEGNWIEQATLLASDAESLQRMGNAVALVGGTALVGASQSSDNGAAYLYTVEDQSWVQHHKLTAPDGAENSRFGHAVALSGDTALVSDFNADVDGNSKQGAAYVFVGVPVLSFDPDNLDFGQVEVGATSSAQDTTLSNTGGSNATGLGFSAPGSGFTVDSADCGNTLAAGDNCTASVTFTPTATGAAAAALSANSDQGVGADLALAGEGIEPGQLAFSPGNLDFGDVEVGATSAPLDTMLSNTGDSDATGLGFSAPGSGFSVVINECGAILTAGGSCLISLTFTPPAAGPASDTLTVDGDNEVSGSLSLSGNGEDPPEPGELNVTPATLDFGEVLIGTGDTRTLTVGNTAAPGADPIELATLDVTAGTLEFSISGGTCQVGTILSPGEDCTVEVTFQPDSAAALSGEFTVTTTDGQMVTVGRDK